jgi:hypothetical protein
MPDNTLARIPVAGDRGAMHELYRRGGEKRLVAPHIVYSDPDCPHPGCGFHIQAIGFRLEDHGRAIHDPLVKSWWNDTGFAGRCPKCGKWIHFTLRGKSAVPAETAAGLPQLPDEWHTKATIL